MMLGQSARASVRRHPCEAQVVRKLDWPRFPASKQRAAVATVGTVSEAPGVFLSTRVEEALPSWSRTAAAEALPTMSLDEAALECELSWLSREAARLQHEAKVQVEAHAPTSTLNGILGHLEQVEEQLVVREIVLQSMHDEPDQLHCLHDPRVEQKAAQVMKQRKAQGMAGLLEAEAAGGVVSESLDETAAEALHYQLEREVACMSAQYTTLLGDILVMKANPEYHFSTSSGKWHVLLQAQRRADDLAFQLLLRQLLLRNLEERPHTCLLSIHDPVLEHEAARIIKQRKQLGQQLSKVLPAAGSHPAALMWVIMSLGNV